MKFLVLSGHHYEEGLRYGKEDIVESDHNLEEVFQNKFRRISDDSPVTEKEQTRMSIAFAKDKLAESKRLAKERAEDPDNDGNLIGTTKDERPPEDPLKNKRKPKLYKAHAGAGRYNVCRVDNDEKVNDKLLSKEEAEAMVDG